MAVKILKNILVSSFICLTLASCAPGLGEGVVPRLSDKLEQNTPNNSLVGQQVILKPISDDRVEPAVVIINERKVPSTIAIPGFVQTVANDVLRDAGAKVVAFDAPALTISVQNWKAIVSPKFPSSTVAAEAGLTVDVSDSKGKLIWRSRYSAEYSTLHPFLTSNAIESTLGDCLVIALREMATDSQFIDALNKARSIDNSLLR